MNSQRNPNLWLALLLLVPGAGTAAEPTNSTWQSDVVVQAGTWSPVTTAQGQVKAWREVSLTAPFPLTVDSVAIEPGQNVSSSQVLARINQSALRTQLGNVRQAQRRTELARLRLTDIQQRLADKLVTRNDLLQAETDLSQARSDENSAWQLFQASLMQLGQMADRKTLAKRLASGATEDLLQNWALVRAPLTGVVAERGIGAGTRMAAGDLLFLLEDLSRIIVEIWVTEAQASLWLQGSATVDSGGTSIRLKPLTEVPEIDRNTGLVKLRFAASNGPRRLLDGQWVSVHLQGAPRNVLWVPTAAVVGRGGKTWCIRHRNDHFEPMEVKVGAEQDGRIPVLSGLNAGDRVVAQGAYLLLYRDLNQLLRFQD